MRADEALPVRGSLLDPETAAGLVNAAMAGVGARCDSVRPDQVRYMPGSSITVRYAARVTWKSGRDSEETLIAMAGRNTPANGPIVEVDGFPVAVWRYPNDPMLPGLAVLAAPGGASDLLSQLHASDRAVTSRVRVYRPGRRAVIELLGPDTRIFVKLVRPRKVSSLQRIHKAIAGALPIPQSLGWSEELGLIALQAMNGETLRSALAAGTGHHPTGTELWALVAALPDLPGETQVVAGPVARSADHRSFFSYVLPEADDKVGAIVAKLGSPSQPTTTVHGDFHTSQILVDDVSVAGMIDVDSVGLGDPVDDIATLIAQLSILAIGPAGAGFAKYGRRVLSDVDQLLDPSDMRRRVAAACLGFATGAFRAQMRDWRGETLRRLELAEQWLAAT